MIKQIAAFWAGVLVWSGFLIGARSQSLTFAGNPQHTGQYSVPAQPLNQIHWSANVDVFNGAGNTHYGAPLITPANTVLAPVRIETGFGVNAFDASSGALKYSLTTDYVMPPHRWLPVYQPVIAQSTSGLRLYYAGAGGTVLYIDNPDMSPATGAVRQCFYTDINNYASNAALFNATVFINSPITADTNGNIFFGFRVYTNGTTPPFTTTNGGFARIDAQGQGTFVLAPTAAQQANIGTVPHNCAPALSLDGSTLYVAAKSLTSDYTCYLLGLDTTTLATKYRAAILQVGSDSPNIMDDATASPTVAPDGDVYYGVYGHSGRGWLLHFTSDLSVRKTPGGFGWDHTAGIVPTNMIDGYSGPASYLVFSKYNNYAGSGDGINRVALMDPQLAQTDPFFGVSENREVLTVIGATKDSQGASLPYAVREWCINTAAINPATRSILFPSEDGRLYRWNPALNALTECIILGPGLGEPYVPTAVGPDGQVYTLNGGRLFALGGYSNLWVSVASSVPDLRSLIAGQPVTFTATVTNLNPADPAPTGTVTFRDMTYQGTARITNTLATAVSLTNGFAAVTVTNLSAGTNLLGNHFITGAYSGDSFYQRGTATLVQKVHAIGTTIDVSSAAANLGSPVIYTANVHPKGAFTGPPFPAGMVGLWDGTGLLEQVPLPTNGSVKFTAPRPNFITNVFWATYASDTLYASSSAALMPFPALLSVPILLPDSSVQFVFSNVINSPFTVLTSGEVSVPLSNWISLGSPLEILPGVFQFTDFQAATNASQRFYRVRSP